MSLSSGSLVPIRVNFPNDREYTFNSLVEELALLERHIRDGSYKFCSCNVEKHLPLIVGLASEGYLFAETGGERAFMSTLRDQARVAKEGIKKRELIDQEDMDELADWAREGRHRVDARDWGDGQAGNPLVFAKKLNIANTDYIGSATKLTNNTKKGDIIGINGGEFIAKGLERGFVEIDNITNRALLKPHLRPSTWMNMILGFGTQIYAYYGKVKAPIDMVLVAAGSHMLTEVVDYAEEYLTATPAAARAAAFNRAAAARVVYRPSGNSRVMTREHVVTAGVPASYDMTPQ